MSSGPINTNDLAHLAVEPDKEGLTVRNAFAGTLAVGTLVYVNGTTTNPATGADVFPTVTRADADGAPPANVATYVVVRAIAQNAFGKVARYAVLRGVDTSAYGTVGDAAYLSTTAGAITPTAPSAANATVQRVGYCAVKSATAGVLVIDLKSNPVQTFGSQSVSGLSGNNAANTTIGAAVAPGASRALTAVEFGIPVEFQLPISDGASGNVDFTNCPFKVLIVSVMYQKTVGAGNVGNSVTLHNGTAGNAITDALNNATDNGTDQAAVLDDAFTTVAAGATLRVVTVRAGGNNACLLTVRGLRVA